MTDSNHSQTQQNVNAWKKLVDGQLDLMSSLHDQAAKLRDQGLEQSAVALDELTRVAKASAQQASELFAAQKRIDPWKKALDKQVEQAAGIVDSLAGMQGERVEHTRAMLDVFTKMSKTSLDHAAKLSKVWHDIGADAAERATTWTDVD